LLKQGADPIDAGGIARLWEAAEPDLPALEPVEASTSGAIRRRSAFHFTVIARGK
jgi:hypothetical protein